MRHLDLRLFIMEHLPVRIELQVCIIEIRSKTMLSPAG